ncbi:hypothetical protein AN2863.2 [Aspergillus nidulans FGSC A4]|nr:hypothetical protein AN2863.2 [Aspergillus nidulans FGSC A4]|eukprot:XP_660467.1 hypothetical protein AN2863.2 [Aspergillus nidulans FGSC A4]
MTSHGTSRHSRYERLLRKHRLETREDRQESILDVGRAGDLQDRGVELHQKRQYQPNPSTTEDQPDTQTSVTAGAESIVTTTQVPQETASASESNILSSNSDQQTTELHTTTMSDDASTTVTAVTTITTTVAYPSDPTTGSGVDLTTSISDHTAVAATAEDVSDERSTTESAPSETSTMATEPSESATGPSTELASADTSTVPFSDSEEPATSPSSELDTIDTSTVPLTDPTESVTAVASMSAALSEAVTEVSGIIASLTSDIESLSASTQQILPVPTSAASPATSVTVSTSVPIISQPSGSSDTPMFSGSSPDIPTAVISTQTPSGTSTESIMGVGSDDGSTSSSEINTDSTTTSITSDSDSSTSTTASETSASNTDSPSQGGYSWGGGSSSDPTGTSDGSSTSSDSGSSSLSPQTTGKIVGGVVGGVAGASLLFLLLWFLLRRRRKTGFFLSSPANRSIADDGGAGGGLIGAPARSEMASRDSNKGSIFGAAYFAPALMKRWRQSQVSTGEESFVSTTPSSERGFQKISGRKLQSGAQPGFDDGNGSLSPTESEISATLPPIIPRSAFSPSQPPPSNPFSMPLDTSYTREAPEEGVPVMRPSPARMPTSGSTNAATWAEASARYSSVEDILSWRQYEYAVGLGSITCDRHL